MARLLGFAALLVASHAALAAAARPAAHRPRAATAAAAVAAAPAANWTLVPVQQAVLDLDLPAEQRWNDICAAFKSSGAWTRERRRASSAQRGKGMNRPPGGGPGARRAAASGPFPPPASPLPLPPPTHTSPYNPHPHPRSHAEHAPSGLRKKLAERGKTWRESNSFLGAQPGAARPAGVGRVGAPALYASVGVRMHASLPTGCVSTHRLRPSALSLLFFPTHLLGACRHASVVVCARTHARASLPSAANGPLALPLFLPSFLPSPPPSFHRPPRTHLCSHPLSSHLPHPPTCTTGRSLTHSLACARPPARPPAGPAGSTHARTHARIPHGTLCNVQGRWSRRMRSARCRRFPRPSSRWSRAWRRP